LRKTFRTNGAMASRWPLIWVVSVKDAILVYHKPFLRLELLQIISYFATPLPPPLNTNFTWSRRGRVGLFLMW